MIFVCSNLNVFAASQKSQETAPVSKCPESSKKTISTEKEVQKKAQSGMWKRQKTQSWQATLYVWVRLVMNNSN